MNVNKYSGKCKQCEQARQKLQHSLCMKCQYDMFANIANDVARASIATVLFSQARKGRTKKYIQQMFKDILFCLDLSNVFGKEITSNDIIETMEKNFEIDFSKIQMKLETKEEFLKR